MIKCQELFASLTQAIALLDREPSQRSGRNYFTFSDLLVSHLVSRRQFAYLTLKTEVESVSSSSKVP